MVHEMEKHEADITDAVGEIKRLYHDFGFTRNCPKCGRAVEVGDDYISYGNMDFNFDCGKDIGGCGHQWEEEAKYFEATLTVVF